MDERMTVQMPKAVAHALAFGDFTAVNEDDKEWFYQEKCRSLGLNPLTQPFRWLALNGKLQLYALKGCSEQLRKLNGVSLWVDEPKFERELVMVHVRGKDRLGREDEDYGFAIVGNLKGEALGNAVLKAITKGKNRTTLSICGLGMLDETEVEAIPTVAKGIVGEEDRDPRLGTPLLGSVLKEANHEEELKEEPKRPEMTPPETARWNSLINTIQAKWAEVLALPKGDAKTRQMEAYKSAFQITRNAELKGKSLADLQEGYKTYMQWVETPGALETGEELMPEIDELIDPATTGEPRQQEQEPAVSTGTAAATTRTGYATPEQIAALRRLAKRVGTDAEVDVQDLLDHYPAGVSLQTYDMVKMRLEGRLPKTEKAVEVAG